jgi:hypothetical protein
VVTIKSLVGFTGHFLRNGDVLGVQHMDDEWGLYLH